jgi:hypothetical protein
MLGEAWQDFIYYYGIKQIGKKLTDVKSLYEYIQCK